nr:MAG: hypothetical protein [Metapenaeopsis lamellata majanivirus]
MSLFTSNIYSSKDVNNSNEKEDGEIGYSDDLPDYDDDMDIDEDFEDSKSVKVAPGGDIGHSKLLKVETHIPISESMEKEEIENLKQRLEKEITSFLNPNGIKVGIQTVAQIPNEVFRMKNNEKPFNKRIGYNARINRFKGHNKNKFFTNKRPPSYTYSYHFHPFNNGQQEYRKPFRHNGRYRKRKNWNRNYHHNDHQYYH